MPTRLQDHQARGMPLPLPDAGAGAHLVGYLLEAGPVRATGMAHVPLCWQDLSAWQHNTGIELNAWEARTLRAMSAAWHHASVEAEAPTCPAPWLPAAATQPDTRRAIASHIRSVLRN